MTNRGVLWIAFAFVHIGVAALGFLMPNEPMGDVYRVYEPWSVAAWQGYAVVGVTEEWVYPPLALLPMLLAHAPGTLLGSYTIGWAVLVTVLDAVAFAILIGRGRSRGRTVAAWFWLAAMACLGPVGMYRLDAVTVPLAILALLWLIGRPWLASMLLAAATWIKVWPAALLAAAFIAVRRRGAVALGAVVVSAGVLGAVISAGGAPHALGFVAGQTARGLQVEAPVSAPYLWGAVAGIDGFSVYYDVELLTFQVTGTQVDTVIAAMTPLMALAAVAIAGVGAWKAWRGVRFVRLFPVLGLALVVALIVCNKVGSPQFHTWLFPVVAFGLVIDRRRWAGPGILVLGAAALTQLVYPVLYGGVLVAESGPALVLTARNLVLIALLAWMAVRLVRLPVPVPARVRAV
ncbi:glycosyltransferase 87 family protein [Microbacterium sp. 179-B 1A2 NHS]|uniref:glycosyltransferase 87 family protein n=1 Tax=Microbacterium sp. 179-B 1A2 NHS TaxID=3142383 RepID=UPI0039A36A27